MKVLAISDNLLPQLQDTKFLRREYSDVEAIISCGDMPAAYLEFIVTTLNVPLLYVRGNHDLEYKADYPGGDNLHGKVMRYKGLTFAGLEGSPRYNNEPIQYSESQMRWMVLGLAPALLWYWLRFRHGIDVMITHASPRDIHDLPDRTHRGFRSLRLLMNLYKPRYLLHGHVDTWDRRRPTVTQYAGTEVINVNPMKVLTLERKGSSTTPG